MSAVALHSDAAPAPAGTYSQGMQAGQLVFLAGQTPRDRHGVRWGGSPFETQVRVVLDNLQAIAQAAGLTLRDAVKVNVFLRDTTLSAQFDAIYADYVGSVPPARTLTQSSLNGFDVEVDAILMRPQQ
jgi:2-iminobutanoate/2-iminopropanoate deaminase